MHHALFVHVTSRLHIILHQMKSTASRLELYIKRQKQLLTRAVTTRSQSLQKAVSKMCSVSAPTRWVRPTTRPRSAGLILATSCAATWDFSWPI